MPLSYPVLDEETREEFLNLELVENKNTCPKHLKVDCMCDEPNQEKNENS